ncbi:hypothetical protein Bhyg_03734, partial [Pseudolycoriella hygida]
MSDTQEMITSTPNDETTNSTLDIDTEREQTKRKRAKRRNLRQCKQTRQQAIKCLFFGLSGACALFEWPTTVANESTSSVSVGTSHPKRVTMSVPAGALKSNSLCQVDSTPKTISQPSNVKRRWQQMATSTSNDEETNKVKKMRKLSKATTADSDPKPPTYQMQETVTSESTSSVQHPDTSSKRVGCVNKNQKERERKISSKPVWNSDSQTVTMFNVPTYESSEEHHEPQTKTKSKKIWMESQTFRNADDAKAFIRQQQMWSINTTNSLNAGKKVIYRCKNAKLREKQCEASVSLFYSTHKADVILYTTANQHTCQENQNAMTDATKSKIEGLFKDGFKTRKAIQCKLAAAKIPLPTKHQLNNFISKLNVNNFGVSSISLGELEAFLRDHSVIPIDDNKAFISDYWCSDANDADFKFFVTTKTLLRNAVGCEIVSADTTYKMRWQGFPISPIGTVDKDRKFHLFGTLVSKDEKTADFRFAFNAIKNIVRKIFQHDMNPKLLICDAAEAIHNGAKSVFGSKIVILMCWFHAKKAVKKNISRFVKDAHVQDEILSDMSLLNLSANKDVFDKASLLFLQ